MGGPDFTLTVNGSNFLSNATVAWNGAPLATKFVSAGQLTALVPAALIASCGHGPRHGDWRWRHVERS